MARVGRGKRAQPVRSYHFRGGKRGAPLPHRGKTRITIWIDDDVLDWFRAKAEREGRGYQTSMNEALNSYVKGNQRPLPEVVRDIVRAEIRSALDAG
ncbi:MAG TPA: BrnA antitoxin family protein [Candidatus Tyrphobacter sp.]